ncbi:MAG TPA: hypothetical protein VD907_00755 [Verrucomicrobiae bacterium]|nr:hypothetical protein [Verrucomicrobiae bacterium]
MAKQPNQDNSITCINDLYELLGGYIKFHYGDDDWRYAKLLHAPEGGSVVAQCEVWPGFEEVRSFRYEDFQLGLVVQKATPKEVKDKVFSSSLGHF